MAQRIRGRLVAAAALLAAVVAPLLAASAANAAPRAAKATPPAANAAPAKATRPAANAAPPAANAALPAARSAPAAAPSTITITGPDVPNGLTLHAEDDPELFAAVLTQVSWLNGRGHGGAPAAAGLGPKYRVVVLVDDVATRNYDLYPLASGGPRAYRPAAQPDKRKTSAAWFYGRLTMSETLRAAGVPLPAHPETLSGGIAGGTRVIPESAINPAEGIDRVFGDLRRAMLLNAAVVLTIAIALAGTSLLLHRRTR